MKDFDVVEITSTEHFAAFSADWEAFRQQYTEGNICLSHAWLLTWCELYLTAQDQLSIYCYFKDQTLVGIFPVYKKKILAGYQLRFLGGGEKEAEEICSEFQDFILVPQYKDYLFSLFLEKVDAMPDLVSLAFENVLSTSLVAKWYQCLNNKAFCNKWQITKVSLGNRFIIPVLSDDSHQALALKSKSSQRQARKYISNTECKVRQPENEQQVVEHLKMLSKLHNKHWQSRGKTGAFENDKFSEFHHKIALDLFKLKQLVLFSIEHQEEVIAIFYGAKDRKVLQYYQSGIANCQQIPSVGVAMHVEALRIARTHQLAMYDLMKGGGNSYKKRLTRSEHPVTNLVAFKRYYTWLPYIWKVQSKCQRIFKFFK